MSTLPVLAIVFASVWLLFAYMLVLCALNIPFCTLSYITGQASCTAVYLLEDAPWVMSTFGDRAPASTGAGLALPQQRGGRPNCAHDPASHHAGHANGSGGTDTHECGSPHREP